MTSTSFNPKSARLQDNSSTGSVFGDTKKGKEIMKDLMGLLGGDTNKTEKNTSMLNPVTQPANQLISQAPKVDKSNEAAEIHKQIGGLGSNANSIA